MNKEELKKAVELAKVRKGIDFAQTNIHLFSGFALKSFNPINTTTTDVADLIRWQCSAFNGSFDTEALNEIAHHGRHKFIIVE